jgi:hypothetical protein
MRFARRKVGAKACLIGDELRFADQRKRNADHLRLLGAWQFDLEQRLAVPHAFDAALEPLSAVDQLFQLYLRLMTGERREVARPHQRPVDAGRRDLEPVAAGHRVERIEQRRKLAADLCAILDRHLAPRPLSHHLHRAAVAARNLDPHQAEAKLIEHRLGEIGDLAPGASLACEAAVSA